MDWIKKAVHGVLMDLTDRRGLRQEWDQIDRDTQVEIGARWHQIIEDAADGIAMTWHPIKKCKRIDCEPLLLACRTGIAGSPWRIHLGEWHTSDFFDGLGGRLDPVYFMRLPLPPT